MAKIDIDEIYTVAGAAKAVGLGETILRSAIDIGGLRARKFGPRSTRIKGKDLQEWFEDQPLVSSNTPSSEEVRETDGKLRGERAVADAALNSVFR